MPDLVAELRRAVERTVARRLHSEMAQRGFGLPSPVTNPNNAVGATGATMSPTSFATGYDGTDTTMAFQWNASVWNGDDLWTGS